ncbi:lipocalin-like domain-containing protein [Acidobacteriota bacterium]
MIQKKNWRFTLMVLAGLAALTASLAPKPFSQTKKEDWNQAKLPYEWSFPRDFGAHPEYKTEWWYFTGTINGPAGEKFGYQLTFFRSGIQKNPSSPQNSWSVRDLYLAHLTITDIDRNQFLFEERMSRGGPGLAGAENGGMNVWLLNWSARMEKGKIFLEARKGEMAIRLNLTPKKPLVFHGQGGLSRKGPEEGQASFYTSYTDLDTSGTISISKDQIYTVTGKSWFDHEFSSHMLSEEQAGWDWFSLHLSDGRELMIYLLRRRDGSVERVSSGTLTEPDGTWRHIKISGVSIDVLNSWRSHRSGGIYPGRWRIRIPDASIEIILLPQVAEQELVSSLIPGLIYWEGAVEGNGFSRNQEITCRGYVELTGYAGSFKGIFD